MMSATFEQQIEADCSVLLIRALLGQTVAAFGEDGLGKHGRNDLAIHYTIEDIDLVIVIDDDEPLGQVALKLENYDASKFGHIMTDQNFLISVRKILTSQHIDPTCLEYSEFDMQGDDFVSFDLDVVKLLDWA
jgi:hypothetical protein